MPADRDSWLRKPLPSAELCRAIHGIGCLVCSAVTECAEQVEIRCDGTGSRALRRMLLGRTYGYGYGIPHAGGGR